MWLEIAYAYSNNRNTNMLKKSLTEQTAVAPSADVAAVLKAVLFVQTGFPDFIVHLPPVDPQTHCPDTHRLASVSSVQSESEEH